MDSWQLESKQEITQEQIRDLLKSKREREAFKRIKQDKRG